MRTYRTCLERLFTKFKNIGGIKQSNRKSLSRNTILNCHITLVLEEDLPTGGEIVSEKYRLMYSHPQIIL